MSENAGVDGSQASYFRQKHAEIILLQWLEAWKIQDPEQRLAACTRCKLDTIQWYQNAGRQAGE